MAATGVLPFIRGADLSHNDFSVRRLFDFFSFYVRTTKFYPNFQGDSFPAEVAEMTQMTWLKLNRANLERVRQISFFPHFFNRINLPSLGPG